MIYSHLSKKLPMDLVNLIKEYSKEEKMYRKNFTCWTPYLRMGIKKKQKWWNDDDFLVFQGFIKRKNFGIYLDP